MKSDRDAYAHERLQDLTTTFARKGRSIYFVKLSETNQIYSASFINKLYLYRDGEDLIYYTEDKSGKDIRLVKKTLDKDNENYESIVDFLKTEAFYDNDEKVASKNEELFQHILKITSDDKSWHSNIQNTKADIGRAKARVNGVPLFKENKERDQEIVGDLFDHALAKSSNLVKEYIKNNYNQPGFFHIASDVTKIGIQRNFKIMLVEESLHDDLIENPDGSITVIERYVLYTPVTERQIYEEAILPTKNTPYAVIETRSIISEVNGSIVHAYTSDNIYLLNNLSNTEFKNGIFNTSSKGVHIRYGKSVDDINDELNGNTSGSKLINFIKENPYLTALIIVTALLLTALAITAIVLTSGAATIPIVAGAKALGGAAAALFGLTASVNASFWTGVGIIAGAVALFEAITVFAGGLIMDKSLNAPAAGAPVDQQKNLPVSIESSVVAQQKNNDIKWLDNKGKNNSSITSQHRLLFAQPTKKILTEADFIENNISLLRAHFVVNNHDFIKLTQSDQFSLDDNRDMNKLLNETLFDEKIFTTHKAREEFEDAVVKNDGSHWNIINNNPELENALKKQHISADKWSAFEEQNKGDLSPRPGSSHNRGK